jgi:hypothetical protein
MNNEFRVIRWTLMHKIFAKLLFMARTIVLAYLSER